MVGIGGIGMSALAQLLASQGKSVSGSDREESPTTVLLEKKGISVMIGEGTDDLSLDTDTLIYSDAIAHDNVERLSAREHDVPEMSYFEALGIISAAARTVAVAGTHGKTTTTGMLAKILQDADVEPTAIVGSIVRDFESNFLAGDPGLFVVEACEYRDHLLKLSPEILVITNVELDHTDYFPNLEALLATFRTAAHKVPRNGIIVCNPAGPHIASILAGASARIVDYTQYAVGELLLPGEFNRENARAALAAAHAVVPSMSLEAGVHSLSFFQGSWRRFEYKGETPEGALVYDDYAHHPTAIEKTLEAVRAKFPGKKIVVAFHPHLHSRTASFLKEFAVALSTCELSIIAPIYAARSEIDKSVTNHTLAAEILAIGGSAKALDSFDDIREELLKCDSNTIILTMGAGDIYKVAEQIAD